VTAVVSDRLRNLSARDDRSHAAEDKDATGCDDRPMPTDRWPGEFQPRVVQESSISKFLPATADGVGCVARWRARQVARPDAHAVGDRRFRQSRTRAGVKSGSRPDAGSRCGPRGKSAVCRIQRQGPLGVYPLDAGPRQVDGTKHVDQVNAAVVNRNARPPVGYPDCQRNQSEPRHGQTGHARTAREFANQCKRADAPKAAAEPTAERRAMVGVHTLHGCTREPCWLSSDLIPAPRLLAASSMTTRRTTT